MSVARQGLRGAEACAPRRTARRALEVGIPPPQRCPLPGWERRASWRTVMASNRYPARVLQCGSPRHHRPGGMDAMTVRRGTLYAGVFLIAAGAVTLGVAAGVLDRDVVANTVGTLWPLAVIALGVGLVLRRSRAALGAGSHRRPGARPRARCVDRRAARPARPVGRRRLGPQGRQRLGDAAELTPPHSRPAWPSMPASAP